MYETENQRVAKTDGPSKKFESYFAKPFRDWGFPIERILDLGYTRPPCDYFAIIPEEGAVPGMACFFELLTTSEAELPLDDVEPEILSELARYGETLPQIHAGFVLNFRSCPDRKIVYISGVDLKNYVDSNPEETTLSDEFLLQYGISMPMEKATPRARKALKMNIPQFLLAIHEADLVRWRVVAATAETALAAPAAA